MYNPYLSPISLLSAPIDYPGRVLSFRFLRIKAIFPVCFRILSEFLQNWIWSPPVLSVFTDFLSWLSWLSKIYTKKAPSGVKKSLGALNAVFFA